MGPKGPRGGARGKRVGNGSTASLEDVYLRDDMAREAHLKQQSEQMEEQIRKQMGHQISIQIAEVMEQFHNTKSSLTEEQGLVKLNHQQFSIDGNPALSLTCRSLMGAFSLRNSLTGLLL
ncbi:hypothetical protein LIER_20798 [Lithospermum erythrorhizon]|uniref:Uncharacterized protein n=1 Tax=Lithospermum erythrorhizon TaxID=34254 RepID=A0AAV3QR85_LITER